MLYVLEILKVMMIINITQHKGRPQKKTPFPTPTLCPQVSAFDQPPPLFVDVHCSTVWVWQCNIWCSQNTLLIGLVMWADMWVM